jgi:hypothetical protein
MTKKMLIVHGYSDGSTSFTGLRDFFVAQGIYDKKDVFLLDYSSMDDEATYRDFADKLDTEYESLFHGERIDIACHSTGSLVTRAWLALRHERECRRKRHLKPRPDIVCPVHRLLMFAPANFGSDLAGMGQSFLGKFRTTFFNTNSFKEDFMESGKTVLQGLEPASPFQWELSCLDLHPNKEDGSFFDRRAKEKGRCYPFVIAAGEGYGGLQSKIVKKRNKPGTDGTVRIAGTSLNTRYCTLDFRSTGTAILWNEDIKFEDIPFAVFAGFNHGSIIDPEKKAFLDKNGPGTLALKALKVKNLADYKASAGVFERACEANYKALKGARTDRYQQFFFKVRDDVNLKVDDYFIDFYVVDSNGKTHARLTEKFDKDFAAEFYTHSDDPACRVMMVNCRKLPEFAKELTTKKAKLVFDVTAKPPLPNVTYQSSHHVVYDGTGAKENSDLIQPNKTLLIDIVLNREADSRVLSVKDENLKPAVKQAVAKEPEPSGRAELLGRRR